MKCSFAAEQVGDFLWEEPPRAVQGTFLVESGGRWRSGPRCAKSWMRRSRGSRRATCRRTSSRIDASNVSNSDPGKVTSPTGEMDLIAAGADAGRQVSGVWTARRAQRRRFLAFLRRKGEGY